MVLIFTHSVVSHSSQPCELWPTRLLHPWDSPGKNTGVGFHFLLQGINPGIEPLSPGSHALAGVFLTTERPQKPLDTPASSADTVQPRGGSKACSGRMPLWLIPFSPHTQTQRSQVWSVFIISLAILAGEYLRWGDFIFISVNLNLKTDTEFTCLKNVLSLEQLGKENLLFNMWILS